jgi:choline kinase
MGGATPKSLLPLGDHPSMLQYLLDGLKKAPVDDLLVVTGHRSSEVEEFVTERWTEAPVSFVRNMRFASWGNFHSVRTALDQSPGMDLMVVNCDIVVNPEIYRRVIEHRGDLILAVQKRKRLDQEDMRVELRGDRVLGVSKHLKMPRSHGEYAGVSLLRGEAHRAYSDTCNDLEWRAQTQLYYEDVYAMMLDRLDARAADVLPGEYAEVDAPEDVPAAVQVADRYF